MIPSKPLQDNWNELEADLKKNEIPVLLLLSMQHAYLTSAAFLVAELAKTIDDPTKFKVQILEYALELFKMRTELDVQARIMKAKED